MSSDRDPVQRLLDGSRDLYDIATWEERTVLDRLSVLLHRWIHRSTRALVVSVAGLILLGQVAIAGFAVLRDPELAVLTLFSIVPALALAGFIWYGDPTLRQSPRSLVVTFVLGVLFAGFAAVANTLLSGVFAPVPVVGMALFFFLVVAPVEETVKWLAVRMYGYRLDEFDAVVDGAIYGAVAGLGFATVENLIYITRVYIQAIEMGANVVPATVGVTGVRTLAGPGHVIYSAFAGYYLGLAKYNPDDSGPIVVKGLLVAALIHGLYNTSVTYAPSFVGLSLAGFAAFVVVYDGVFLFVLLRKISRYRSAYKEARATDGTAGTGTE